MGVRLQESFPESHKSGLLANIKDWIFVGVSVGCQLQRGKSSPQTLDKANSLIY